jgi:hypothetical protein
MLNFRYQWMRMSKRQMGKGKKRRHHQEAQSARLWRKRERVLERKARR